MANNNKKKMLFTTPKGTAMYPWLTRPDTQFHPEGQYKVSVRMSKEDAQQMMDDCRDAANDAFGDKAKEANMPWKADADTGEIVLITKSKYQPRLVDSTGQVIADAKAPQVNSGSTIKAAGTMYPYNAGGKIGISLQLAGVQIIELAKRGDGDMGFGNEGEGFVAAAENDNSTGTEDTSYNF
tara:strand:+ start:4076 stop:4621 length:546 start_codon:yes stop_codon:yes gene_type:complete